MSTTSDDRDAPLRLVDWELAGRRLLRLGVVLPAIAVVGWVVLSLVTGQWRIGTLGNLLGLALFGLFLVELWVVGGSALRGMLRAGEAGDRLAGTDVGLLPPQLRPGGRIKPVMPDAFAEQRQSDGGDGGDAPRDGDDHAAASPGAGADDAAGHEHHRGG